VFEKKDLGLFINFKNMKYPLTLLFFAILIYSCTNDNNNTKTEIKKEIKSVDVPNFNSDSAYNFVEKQVAFGPRVPNSNEHIECAKYLVAKLKEFGAEVIEQDFIATAFDGTKLKSKNIIGQFQADRQRRVLLTAHWDTRPFADNETDNELRNKPILGANDGASGVGVLMEIARIIGQKNTSVGVDIIFFDSEDYGQADFKNIDYQEDTWCLGSQYWAKNLHKPNYYAQFGILLDMVGAKNALFTKEGTSMYFAPGIVEKVWNTASKIGYSDYFLFQKTNAVTDDHLYVNQIAGIQCIDIIQHDPTTNSKFGAYWHTQSDNMDVIDKNTLKAVGQTLLEVVYNE